MNGRTIDTEIQDMMNYANQAKPKSETKPRWCIYIDLLGFSQFWKDDPDRALNPLNKLMLAIFRIGTKVYPKPGERLFAHQMGDGFAIVGESYDASLERPIAIAIALMRCVASTNTFATASIAEGDFADIVGCYPREVRDGRGCSDHDVIRLGMGLMTLSTVMGTAFIRAYQLHKRGPSGPFLTVATCHQPHIPESLSVRTVKGVQGEPLLSIDWIQADTLTLTRIQEQACLERPKPDKLLQTIKDYCVQSPKMSDRWGPQLCDLLGVRVE